MGSILKKKTFCKKGRKHSNAFLLIVSEPFERQGVLGTSIGEQHSLDFRKLRRELKHQIEEKQQPLAHHPTVELSRELEKLIKQARLQEAIKGTLVLTSYHHSFHTHASVTQFVSPAVKSSRKSK